MKTWQECLRQGQVIPACPLALEENGKWSRRHQRGLLRYYLAARAGGVAVGVHTTQFDIRLAEHGLYEPLLRETAELLDAEAPPHFIRVAGICGETDQALAEARTAVDLGYHCGLLNLSALRHASDAERIAHCRAVGEVLPLFGFFLQPAIGGCLLQYEFWRAFCELPTAVAIKIAAFNRYQTWDVIRAVMESGRDDLALYTGNDDNIIADLITPFHYRGQTRRFAGGLLGQWAVWTKTAVEMLHEIQALGDSPEIPSAWLTRNAELTDANGVIFDAAHQFAGCIPGINEVLRRQSLLPSSRCLNPDEKLSPGQSGEIDRILHCYPHLTDAAFVQAHYLEWLG